MGMFREAGGSDGTIVSYIFTAKEWPAKKGGEPYTTLSFDFKFLADGAEEPGDRFLNAGFIHEGVTVSEDGLTLESDRDGGIIQANTEFARFFGSAVALEPKIEGLVDENGRNFEGFMGTRLQLTQWVDEEATKKFGKRVSKKDGKSYNRTETRVGAVYSLPEEKSKGKATKTAAKPAAKGATAKPAKKEAAAPDTDRFDNVLLELLANAKDSTIQRSAISSMVVRYHLNNKETITTEDRETLRKALSDEDYLKDAAARGIITYNGSSKKQEIGLA